MRLAPCQLWLGNARSARENETSTSLVQSAACYVFPFHLHWSIVGEMSTSQIVVFVLMMYNICENFALVVCICFHVCPGICLHSIPMPFSYNFMHLHSSSFLWFTLMFSADLEPRVFIMLFPAWNAGILIAPGAHVCPSTNIGYLTGFLLGFSFRVLVFGFSFRVLVLGFSFRVLVLGFRF